MSLTDRLAALYTERADLLERRERITADVTANMQDAMASQPSGQAPPTIGAVLSVAAKGQQHHVALDRELAWVERQILALLGNPGLAREERSNRCLTHPTI